MKTVYEDVKYEPKKKLPEGFVEKYNMPKYPALDTAKLISNFSDSTLFFIFYYQQGTPSQVLAADELVKRKWYYQPKYMTWFRDNESSKDPAKGKFDYSIGSCFWFYYLHFIL